MKQKSNILIIRPCHTKGMIMAEARVSDIDDYYDMEKLNAILKTNKDFTNINYSKEIETISADYNERQIFIFSNSFIRIKQARSRKDAEESFDLIKEIASKAIRT